VAGVIWDGTVFGHLYYRGKEHDQYLLENGYALPVLNNVEPPTDFPTTSASSALENNTWWDDNLGNDVAVQDNHNVVVNWDG